MLLFNIFSELSLKNCFYIIYISFRYYYLYILVIFKKFYDKIMFIISVIFKYQYKIKNIY